MNSANVSNALESVLNEYYSWNQENPLNYIWELHTQDQSAQRPPSTLPTPTFHNGDTKDFNKTALL